MTGVEVFANLVAAYDGTAAQKSNKAFLSLMIIMGTTAITMLVVGPVIYSVADPTDLHVSVFTQTMDQFLPNPLPYFGTLVGIAVLMSASAASTQGLQNPALGLKERRYIPHRMGEPNKYAVADLPVWIEVGIVCFFFLLLGTHEEIYLAIYAAGVFILLSMTGWAVTKHLVRNAQASPSAGNIPLILGTIIAASLTSGATIVIFAERFWEGAWTYFIFIPTLYALFTYFRNRYGDPTPEMRLSRSIGCSASCGIWIWAGCQSADPDGTANLIKSCGGRLASRSSGSEDMVWSDCWYSKNYCSAGWFGICGARDSLCQGDSSKAETERLNYLNLVAADLASSGIDAEAEVETGSIFDISEMLIQKNGFGLVITSTRGGSGERNWLRGGSSHKLVEKIDTPVLLVPVDDQSQGIFPKINRILIALAGSSYSERALPYARLLAKAFDSQLVLLCVSAVPEADDYRAPADIVLKIRQKAEANMYKFLAGTARLLRKDGSKVDVRVTGSIPSHAILAVAEEGKVDMLMLTSQGRGGYNALLLGSVAEYVVQNTKCPVFMVPIQVESKTPDMTSGD